MNRKILKNIIATGKQVIPAGGKMWLYGSQARGEARPDSDWDLLVLIDKDILRGNDYDSITYPLTTLGWDIGAKINPILYTKKEWESYHFTPFYHNVQQDKVELI
ncbi:MAG: nucleotidyltransferase domain-containing protein [Paludibacteraceae bacterium]|nr:nucleotidyltransferase domain-containing protein [Paludibacteraceae bacterium]